MRLLSTSILIMFLCVGYVHAQEAYVRQTLYKKEYVSDVIFYRTEIDHKNGGINIKYRLSVAPGETELLPDSGYINLDIKDYPDLVAAINNLKREVIKEIPSKNYTNIITDQDEGIDWQETKQKVQDKSINWNQFEVVR